VTHTISITAAEGDQKRLGIQHKKREGRREYFEGSRTYPSCRTEWDHCTPAKVRGSLTACGEAEDGETW